MVQTIRRTNAAKLEQFRSFFSGLPHAYGTYDPHTGRARQVKEPVTDAVMLAHLRGEQSYGVYLLKHDRTRALAVDFDEEDLNAPLAFVTASEVQGIAAHIERSKSKGYHVWVFFDGDGVLCATARAWARGVLQEIGKPQTEVFPKQDRLTSDTSYGNYINAPLFGRLVAQGRTVFLNPADHMQPYADQWEFLAQVRRVTSDELDAAASGAIAGPSAQTPTLAIAPPEARERDRTFGLPPCAQTMLQGVESYQRVICFRLAIHLKTAGIPCDLATALLRAWAGKNRPCGKPAIGANEVEDQVTCAYAKDYRSCGCEDPEIMSYCRPTCPLFLRRPPRNRSIGQAQVQTGELAEAGNADEPGTV